MSTGGALLERQPGPFQTDPGRELGDQRLDRFHGLARADPGRGLTHHLRGGQAVVALQTRRAVDPASAGEGGEGHHLAVGVARVPVVQVLGHHAEGCVGLEIDLFHTPLVDEVVDIGAAPGGSERGVDVREREPERAGLGAIDLDLELRLVLASVGPDRGERGIGVRHPEELPARRHQGLVAHAAAVLELGVPARAGTELDDGRRHEGEDLRIADLREGLHRPPGDRLDLQVRPFALVPVLHAHEPERHVLALSGEAEAGHGDELLDRLGLVFEEMALDLAHDLPGALARGACGQHHLGDEDALVLVRQEGGGQAGIGQAQADDEHEIDHEEQLAPAQDALYTLDITAGAAVEAAVEPAEEAASLALMSGLEQGRRQGGAQGQGDHHGQQHGRDDGDGELPIDDPGRAAEEGHRHEHGGEHQRDADQCTGDLIHGAASRLLGRQTLLVHDALDVLHHHDGVVHQQTDRQHHRE